MQEAGIKEGFNWKGLKVRLQRKGTGMKILVLLLSFNFVFLSGCGDENTEATTTPPNGLDSRTPENEQGGLNDMQKESRGDELPKGANEGLSGDTNTPLPPLSSPPPAVPAACLPYIEECSDNIECSKKHSECLEPSAGTPDVTETTTCTKTNEPDVHLVLREWNHPAGKNKLLCDLFINNNVLKIFATNTKNSCRQVKEKEQQKFLKRDYICQ